MGEYTYTHIEVSKVIISSKLELYNEEHGTRSIERNLKKLQKDKKIKRVGGDKGGHWVVI